MKLWELEEERENILAALYQTFDTLKTNTISLYDLIAEFGVNNIYVTDTDTNKMYSGYNESMFPDDILGKYVVRGSIGEEDGFTVVYVDISGVLGESKKSKGGKKLSEAVTKNPEELAMELESIKSDYSFRGPQGLFDIPIKTFEERYPVFTRDIIKTFLREMAGATKSELANLSQFEEEWKNGELISAGDPEDPSQPNEWDCLFEGAEQMLSTGKSVAWLGIYKDYYKAPNLFESKLDNVDDLTDSEKLDKFIGPISKKRKPVIEPNREPSEDAKKLDKFINEATDNESLNNLLELSKSAGKNINVDEDFYIRDPSYSDHYYHHEDDEFMPIYTTRKETAKTFKTKEEADKFARYLGDNPDDVVFEEGCNLEEGGFHPAPGWGRSNEHNRPDEKEYYEQTHPGKKFNDLTYEEKMKAYDEYYDEFFNESLSDVKKLDAFLGIEEGLAKDIPDDDAEFEDDVVIEEGYSDDFLDFNEWLYNILGITSDDMTDDDYDYWYSEYTRSMNDPGYRWHEQTSVTEESCDKNQNKDKLEEKLSKDLINALKDAHPHASIDYENSEGKEITAEEAIRIYNDKKKNNQSRYRSGDEYELVVLYNGKLYLPLGHISSAHPYRMSVERMLKKADKIWNITSYVGNSKKISQRAGALRTDRAKNMYDSGGSMAKQRWIAADRMSKLRSHELSGEEKKAIERNYTASMTNMRKDALYARLKELYTLLYRSIDKLGGNKAAKDSAMAELKNSISELSAKQELTEADAHDLLEVLDRIKTSDWSNQKQNLEKRIDWIRGMIEEFITDEAKDGSWFKETPVK